MFFPSHTCTSLELTCLKYIDLFVFTAGEDTAGSDGDLPYLHIEGTHDSLTIQIPDLPGDDMERNKGDWYSIGIPGCWFPNAITGLKLTAGSSDGWKIDSAIALGWMSHDQYFFLSANYGAYKWLDTDNADQTLDLTLPANWGTVPNGTHACIYMK